MKTVLYVVSTLAKSGPTAQLLNIVRHLDRDAFLPIVLTLSSEPRGTMRPLFNTAGVEVRSLALSRLEGLLLGKHRLAEQIASLVPDIVHSQGIRADTLISKLGVRNWIATVRNYPFDDYPMKFGRIRGSLMAHAHLRALSACEHVVACSISIGAQLSCHGISATPVQNGVELSRAEPLSEALLSDMTRPVFVTAGSLIERKNTSFLVSAMRLYAKRREGSFLVLGDGPQLASLRELAAGAPIRFAGNVDNVGDFLRGCDCFVSASLSEGLPNAVLEGFSAAVPAILSDIPSHREIHEAAPDACRLFSLDDGIDSLVALMDEFASGRTLSSPERALAGASLQFSASRMSHDYQKIYRKVCQP